MRNKLQLIGMIGSCVCIVIAAGAYGIYAESPRDGDVERVISLIFSVLTVCFFFCFAIGRAMPKR